jgi:peptidoglycan hydrolase CwlO-like protein
MPPELDAAQLAALGGFLTAIVAGFWAWLAQRTTATERLQQSTFEQAEATIKRQGESLLRLEGRVEQLSTQMQGLLAQNTSLEARNAVLESELTIAKKTIADLEIEVSTLKQQPAHTTTTSITKTEEIR